MGMNLITKMITKYYENSKYYKTIHRMPCYTELINEISEDTVIEGSLKTWRTTYPNAIVANISNRTDLCDEDFIYLRGIRVLNMNNCNQTTITDIAFENLYDLHTLKMKNCNQTTITDNAFKNLKNIEVLNITNCNQETITDNAFNHFTHIHTLFMEGCNQKTLHGFFFEKLTNLNNLSISYKDQYSIIINALIIGCHIHIPREYKRFIEGKKNSIIYKINKNI